MFLKNIATKLLSGGILLDFGSIPDGTFLQRSGSSIIGGGAAVPNFGPIIWLGGDADVGIEALGINRRANAPGTFPGDIGNARAGIPVNGIINTIMIQTETANGSTQFDIKKNNSIIESLILSAGLSGAGLDSPGIFQAFTNLGISVVPGDDISIEPASGTDPNDCLASIFIEPTSSNERWMSIPFGADFNVGGGTSPPRWMLANGSSGTDSVGSSGDQTNAIVPIAGTIKAVNITRRNTTGVVNFRVDKNGVSQGTFAVTATNFQVISLNIAVVAGDRLEVVYDSDGSGSGIASMAAELLLEPSADPGIILPFGTDLPADPSTSGSYFQPLGDANGNVSSELYPNVRTGILLPYDLEIDAIGLYRGTTTTAFKMGLHLSRGNHVSFKSKTIDFAGGINSEAIGSVNLVGKEGDILHLSSPTDIGPCIILVFAKKA